MIIKHTIFSLMALAVGFINLSAQEDFSFIQKYEIPVMKDGATLDYAWSGGFSNPQFFRVDVNNDSALDLVIFDRADSQFLTFINNDNVFQLDDKQILNYPEINSWAVFEDYNCDGITDLFAPNGPGITVYDGYFNEKNQLSFTLAVENIEGPNEQQYLFNENAYPAIKDFDGDGKLDILDFKPNSGFMYLYKNVSNDCEPLTLEVSDSCWGDFFENGIEKKAILDTVCGGGDAPLPLDEFGNLIDERGIHPGSTIQAVDFNNDQAYDVLIGNIMFNSLLFMNNTGSQQDAHISSQDSAFPSYNEAVNIQSFPAAFNIDIDFDGLKDLLVSPFNINALDPYFTCWYYKNIGTTDKAEFELKNKSFMIDQSFDVGLNAHPAFFDYNGDGLKDLVIGNKSSTIFEGLKKASLTLYENVGTQTEPAFEFVTNDYLGLTEYGLLDIVPAFGDINGDGAEELFLGMSGFSDPSGDFNGTLVYFENLGSSSGEANFGLPQFKYKDIDVGQFSAPTLFDVNDDGKMDLIIGKVSGLLHYYENIGTTTVPEFAEPNKSWGKVSVGTTLSGFSVPQLFRSDAFDGIQLIMGSEPGDLKWYEIDAEGLAIDSFKLSKHNFEKQYGRLTSPALADLTGDGIPELIAGTRRGGIIGFSWEEKEVMDGIEQIENTKTELVIYPTPADDYLNIEISDNNTEVKSVELYTSNGKVVFSRNYSDFSRPNYINTSDLISGIYLLKVNFNDHSISRKILIQH